MSEAKLENGSRSVMAAYLEQVLPGRSELTTRLREEILDFSISPLARTLLLQGPIGAGKSTVARIVALMKRVAPLRANEAHNVLEGIQRQDDGSIKPLSIPWYVELTLTGLVPDLANAQLFGHAKGAFTGATHDRAGVFEAAATGQRKRGVDALSEAAVMTGGVVLLDEVGDLDSSLQAKLLPVLSGGAFYRVGGEGDPKHQISFEGTTLCASWKELNDGSMRADLLSRIASYSMYVPSLSERMEDFDLILDQLERSVRQRTVDYITRVMQVEKLADGDYWAAVKKRVPRLSTSERASLAAFDWANHGNLRGLASAVEQVLSRSMPVARALSNLTAVRSRISAPTADLATGFVARLLGRVQSGRGLAAHVGDVESEVRSEIRDKLKGDPGLISKLSTQLRIPTESLIAQLSQLDRTRRRTR